MATAISPTDACRTLDEYLALEYSLRVTADPEGGYVLDFPDLPGCMTQVDTWDEVSSAAREIKQLWLESAYRQGLTIPLPTYPEDHSGKFNLRIPRSLHRRLAEAAEQEGVSLNQYVLMVLSQGAAPNRINVIIERFEAHQQRVEQSLTSLCGQINEIHAQMTSYRLAPSRPQPGASQLEVVYEGKRSLRAVAA